MGVRDGKTDFLQNRAFSRCKLSAPVNVFHISSRLPFTNEGIAVSRLGPRIVAHTTRWGK